MQDKRICIGKIASAHGVKGLVKIFPYCEDISLLNGVLLIGETGEDTLTITLKNPIGKYILAEIQGVTSREQAQEIKHSLFVLREKLPEIGDKDSYYYEDLCGLSVINDKKHIIGTVLNVHNYGAGDLLEVKPENGATYYVPFEDNYINEVDLKTRQISIVNADHFIVE